MIKTITRVGNSKGIILDSALLELAHWKEGDQLAVTVHESGAITSSPVDARVIEEEDFDGLLDNALKDFDSTLEKLS